MSIPIGSGPDVEDDDDEDDPVGPRDSVVERWLNGSVADADLAPHQERIDGRSFPPLFGLRQFEDGKVQVWCVRRRVA